MLTVTKTGTLVLNKDKEYNEIPETVKIYFVVMITMKIGQGKNPYDVVHEEVRQSGGLYESYQSAKKKHDSILRKTQEIKEKVKNDHIIRRGENVFTMITNVEIRRVTEVVRREIAIYESESAGERVLLEDYNCIIR